MVNKYTKWCSTSYVMREIQIKTIIRYCYISIRASLLTQLVKNPPAMQETWVWVLGPEDPLEKEMETYSSILAWKIQWTEEPGGLQSMGSQESDITWQPNHLLWWPKSRTLNTKYCLGYGAAEALIHYWWECKVGQLLWKTIWCF